MLRAAERGGARDRALVVLMLFAGLRIGEVVALDVEDVTISARKGVVVVRSGKGDAYREVALNALVRAVLEEWIAERNLRVTGGETALFLSLKGSRISPRAADAAVRRVAGDGSLQLSAHVLRHTCLTNLVRQGATVSMEGGHAVYRAALGDADNFAVSVLGGVRFTREGGPAIVAGFGCSGAGEPICPYAPVELHLLDRDDRALLLDTGIPQNRHPVTVHGGSGDDFVQLFRVDGPVEVNGGDGGDTVAFAYAADVSLDDQPNDSADVLLADRIGGHNVRSDVEALAGSDEADRLTGSAGPNRLEGKAGNDRLVGGDGVDAISGGVGDDSIESQDGVPEVVDCGSGEVDVVHPDASDTLIGCEVVADIDNDTFRTPLDCNDLNPAVHPGAAEVAENGVDENCDGRDAENLDRDGDGFNRPGDCDDGNPAIRPTAVDRPGNHVDEDCDGRDAPYPRITSGVVNSWRVTARHTRVLRLTINEAPVGARIRVRCRGRGCPKKVVRRRGTGARELRLAPAFKGRRLRPGAVIEVRILMPDAIGKVVRYRIRRTDLPEPTVLCLAPGQTHARQLRRDQLTPRSRARLDGGMSANGVAWMLAVRER